MKTVSRPKRPRDPNQLAKLITDLATGDATPAPEPKKKPPKKAALKVPAKGA